MSPPRRKLGFWTARALLFALPVALVLGATPSGAHSAVQPTPGPTPTTVVEPTPAPTAEPVPPADTTPPGEPPPQTDVKVDSGGEAGSGPQPAPAPTANPLAPDRDTPPTDEVPQRRAQRQEVVPQDAPRAATPADAVAVPNTARVSGTDRFATSVAASANAFPSGASTVLVASGTAPADGIVAAGLAAALQAPLLYVQQNAVPDVVAAEITRLGPQRIVIVGGALVVGDGVATRLSELAPQVGRYGGGNRYESSRLALSELGSAVDTVYVSGGLSLVDSSLASVAAAATSRGALLVNGGAAADAATIEALRAAGARNVVIVGGYGTVGVAHEDSLRAAGFAVSRKVGSDRYAQSVLMAAERTSPVLRAIVVNSFTDPDLAVAAALAAVSRQPLYYAIEPCTPDPVAAAIAGTGAAVTAVGGPVWLGPAVLVNRSCTAEKDLRQSQLNSAIRAAIAQYPGVYSVSVHQLDGLRVTTDVGGGVRREPASMMKIYAAWAALQLIERGQASWGTRLPSGVDLSTCIHVMIHASDNGCHSDIVHWIGIGRLNWMIQSSGWTETSYGSVPPGTSILYAGNRTTSNNLSNILERLASGNALSRPYADHLLRLMTDQIWRSRIASGIPPGVRQATKPGSLWVSSGLMQGDSGVVWGTDSTYVLSIIGDQAPPQAALRAISRAVYEYFNGPFGVAAWYPAQQMATVRATALRTSPGGAMTVVLPAGAPVEVLDADRIWYQLRYGDRRLWTVFTDLRNR